MKRALIIGGGFAGCAAAHLLSQQENWDITLVEAAPFLGGGCRTLWYGGHPYTFGPRHFLTQNEKVYEYLNKHCPLRRCNDHVFLTFIEQDAQFYNYPIHIDDVGLMPESDQIQKELKETQKLKGGIEAKNFEEETPVNIIIRHEGIKLIDKVDHTLPKAKVLETRLLGRFSLVHLQVETGNSKVHLHARVPGLSYLKPQTKIGIEVDSVQSYIFPV